MCVMCSLFGELCVSDVFLYSLTRLLCMYVPPCKNYIESALIL
jgi:hypothetical protein